MFLSIKKLIWNSCSLFFCFSVLAGIVAPSSYADIKPNVAICGYDQSEIIAPMEHCNIFSPFRIEAKRPDGYPLVVKTLVATTKNGFDYLYIGTDEGVFKSRNSKTNWTAAGLIGKDINVLHFYNGDLYAGTNEGVFKSNDEGVRWTVINDGLTNKHIEVLCEHAGELYAGTANGVFKTNNEGITWVVFNEGFEEMLVGKDGANVTCMSSYSGDLYVGIYGYDSDGSNSYAGIYKRDRRKDAWNVVQKVPNDVVESFALLDGYLYAGCHYGLIYRSNDSGNRWISIDGLTYTEKLRTLCAHNGNLYVVTTDYGTFKYRDKNRTSHKETASTWENIDLTWQRISDKHIQYDIGSLYSYGGSLYAITKEKYDG